MTGMALVIMTLWCSGYMPPDGSTFNSRRRGDRLSVYQNAQCGARPMQSLVRQQRREREALPERHKTRIAT
jgi:hypothetical protein